MAEQLRELFGLRDVLLMSVRCRRADTVPAPLTVGLHISARINQNSLPGIDVWMRVTSEPKDTPLSLDVEVVSIFANPESATPPTKEQVVDFVNQKALPLMWPYIDSIVRHVTASMSIPGLKILLPLAFDLPVEAFADPSPSASPSLEQPEAPSRQPE